MQGHAEPPTSAGALAPQHVINVSEAVEQIAGHVGEAAGAVTEAVFPAAPFVTQGLRLEWAAKRSLDVSVAVTALFVLLPLLLLIAVIVWAGDRKPPIYRHMRLGRDGRRFGCLKFRSMVVDGDAVLTAHLAANPQARAEWAAMHKLSNDPRITPSARCCARPRSTSCRSCGTCSAAR